MSLLCWGIKDEQGLVSSPWTTDVTKLSFFFPQDRKRLVLKVEYQEQQQGLARELVRGGDSGAPAMNRTSEAAGRVWQPGL